ncbi:MAG TPA: extracellular solute-binding protein [Casimicrobiaceae bacterium]|nr:extracellular solute-binding protein [Casimicrobiaceae bacterium]
MAVVAALATAQAPPAVTDAGADRMQKLVDAARREGELTLYTSTPVDDMKVMTDAFERKYGVKTKVWRASSEKVLQRAVAEARAGRFDADVYDTNGPELEALVRERMLLPISSPALADLLPEAVFPHRAWVGARLVIFAFAYNTNLVKKSELPSSYEGFADPRWKGKLAIEADDADWFATVSGLLGEREAERLFRAIVANNGVSLRKGHTLLANLVAAGEVPLALTVYNYKAEQLKSKGAPIDWFVLPPAIARVNGLAVSARAPHPNAAMLWFEFVLGVEGQRLLLTREFVPTNRRVETTLNRFPLRFVDSAAVLDESAKWEKRYADIFGGQPR